MMRGRTLLLFNLLLLSLISCGTPGVIEQDDLVMTGTEQNLSWSLDMPSGPFQFTDRISAKLTLRETGSSSYSFFRPDGDVWGDFRVRRMTRSGAGWQVELLPRHEGTCRLAIPVDRDGHLFMQFNVDKEFSVESVLEEGDSEPAGLLENEDIDSPRVWFVAAGMVVVLGGVVLVCFLFYRQKRKYRKEDVPETDLKGFLDRTEDFPEGERGIDLYRELFRLLLTRLDGLHPGLKGRGCGPVELQAVLETPSSLNQWNLRSLYPLLSRMEELFFSPDPVLPDRREFEEHRTLLKGWIALLEEEKK